MLVFLAILALSVLIIIHEFGHFVCAKIGGMHVDRFSVLGIGPVILKLFTWKGTEFVISAIPFGAYVHIVGMEPEEYALDEEGNLPPPPAGYRNFRDSPLWARLLAISGGAMANYIAAMVMIIALTSVVGLKESFGVQVTGMTCDSPAAVAGIEAGDELLSIDGQPITGPNYAKSVNELTGPRMGTTVDIEVLRGEQTLHFDVALASESRALKVDLRERSEYVPISPGQAIVYGSKWPYVQTAVQLRGLWAMLTGKSEGKVGGPVAIVKVMKNSADRGIADFIVISALISTVLGMFNLLPLPALDGGRLIFLIYELISRRAPNKLLEERIHMIGMIALLALIAWATVNDVRPAEKPAMWQQLACEFELEALKLERAAESSPDAAPPATAPTVAPGDG